MVVDATAPSATPIVERNEKAPQSNDPLPHGLHGAEHFASWAMTELHKVRRAVDLVRIEAAAFADDESRPRSERERREMMGYVDLRLRGLTEAIARVEIAVESAQACMWEEAVEKFERELAQRFVQKPKVQQ